MSRIKVFQWDKLLKNKRVGAEEENPRERRATGRSAEKVRMNRPRNKTMLIIFFHAEEVVQKKFLLDEETVTGQF